MAILFEFLLFFSPLHILASVFLNLFPLVIAILIHGGVIFCCRFDFISSLGIPAVKLFFNVSISEYFRNVYSGVLSILSGVFGCLLWSGPSTLCTLNITSLSDV